MASIRLQKILSTAGVASRRAAEALIEQGRVSVNGATVAELGSKADPERDDIRVDGRRVKAAAPRRYFLLNKPRGFITTRSDPQHRPTVIDILASHGIRDYVYPVGRLDYDSEGLLILTSDGELAERLMHPSHGVDRTYEVRVLGVPDEHELQRIARGVIVDGRRTAAAEIAIEKVIEKKDGAETVLSIVIHEGRNRQVRKMCDAIGHPVERLRRVAIGPISDERLRPGDFRELTSEEISLLKRQAGKSAESPVRRRRPAGIPSRTPASRPGSGQAPRPGSGQAPRPGSGQASRPRSGQAPRPRSGQAFRPGSGQASRPRSGQAPRPGSGQAPRRRRH